MQGHFSLWWHQQRQLLFPSLPLPLSHCCPSRDQGKELYCCGTSNGAGSTMQEVKSAGREQLGVMHPEESPQDGLAALFVSPALEQRMIQKSFLCHLVYVWQRPAKWENSFLCAPEHPHGSHDAIFLNTSIWAFNHS